MTQSPTTEAAPVQTGFDSFVTSRGGRLWRAWYLTGDRHKAEDLVQTALTKAYGRYEALGDDEQFEAYVRTTMYRTYVKWWRRRWNGELPSHDVPEVAVDPTLTPARIDLACPVGAAEDAARRAGASLPRGPRGGRGGRTARHLGG